MKVNRFVVIGMLHTLLATTSGQEILLGDARPNFDRRYSHATNQYTGEADLEADVAQAKARIPGREVDFDSLFGLPKYVRSPSGFLTEAEEDRSTWPVLPAGVIAPPLPPPPDKSDHYRALRKFLDENADWFGHDASVLASARITREFVTQHNQVRTAVWQQEVSGVPVFESILKAHLSRGDRLISLSSQLYPNLAGATFVNSLTISAATALALAARNIGEEGADAAMFAPGNDPQGSEQLQKFTGEPIIGEAEVSFVWLPISRSSLRLCWRVVLTGRQSGKLFQILIDAQTGEAWVRHCWTHNAAEATYFVFDRDSAAPLLPGWSTPITNQPPVTSQTNVTFTALSTNASPVGWVNTNAAIFGLTNTTFGNNVDAHLDLTNANPAYGTNVQPPRPMGVVTNGRVEFTGTAFTADLTQSPTNSPTQNAAVVNAFYWCNWMHDKLYDLGFTEGAGSFQYDNYGHGGAAGDAVQMDVQEITGAGGAASASPQDGGIGRLELSLWNYSSPARDGDFDTTLILHEYTHLLSTRLVAGGGRGTYIGALEEGWSDFYPLALLSEVGDDVYATYPVTAYASYQWLTGTFEQNYYFGIRAYPYSTDATKNPMTLGDLQADPEFDPHPGIPISPLYNPTNGPFQLNEEHTRGQIWGGALWDARANLIQKHGFTNGNWLILQLATDGMKLGPANPTFLQARDAILQADMIKTGGQNALELWAAFAKRGMGYNATNTPGDTAIFPGDPIPVRESFSIPPSFESGGAIYSSPACAADSTIYIGASNKLFALNNEGTEKWEFGGLTTNYAFNSSAAIGPGRVIYVGCNDSNLYAVASSGTMLWRTNLGGGVFSSPAIGTDGTIYVGSSNGVFYAVNEDGAVKWSNSTGATISSSPAVALDGTIYVGTMGGYLYAFNPTNGAVLSGWPVTAGSGVYSSPAIASDGSVHVGSLDGNAYAFTAGAATKSGWPFTTGGAVCSSPAISSNGTVYVGSSDGRLYAINANGSTNWTYQTGGSISCSPAIGQEGRIFVGSDDGNFYLLNPDGSVLLACPVGSPIFSSPAFNLAGQICFGSTGGNVYQIPTRTLFADGPWPMFRHNLHHSANAETLFLRRPQQITAGTFVFDVSGPAGAACDVEATTNLLSSWTFLSTVTLTNGVASVETTSTGLEQRFFRAKFGN